MGMPEVTRGTFDSTKITVWNFGNFTSPMERYIQVAKTWAKPPLLVIVLVSRIQKSGTEDNSFLSNEKRHFGPTNRNDQTGQSGPPSKLVPNIPVGPNRNGPFHFMCQPKFTEFWVERRAPKDCRLSFRQVRHRMLRRFPPSGFFLSGNSNVNIFCWNWSLAVYLSHGVIFNRVGA